MMNAPPISIIIPVYNVEPYIERCLVSVMNQTYCGAIECIIIDDCGEDNSMAVTERLITDYKGPISFKILHHTHNRGLSAARNTGIDAATADYLFFLDSDDALSPNSLALLATPIQNDPTIEMVTGNRTRDPAGSRPELIMSELARALAMLRGVQVVTSEGEQKGYCAYRRTALDTSALERLGWKPSVSLDEGIRRVLQFHLE